MQRIAVLGANGVYARHLLPRLMSAGLDVVALVRRPEAAGVARGCGVAVKVADIFDEASMVAAFEGCDVAVNLATSLPGPSGRGDFAENDRLRVEGGTKFLRACRAAGVARVLQQSISFVNASGDARWSDEDFSFAPTTETVASRAIAAALRMEEGVRASGLDCAILRGGLFYGPGTGFDDGWFARAAQGKLRVPGDGTSYVSLVHIADMASATVAALRRWPRRQSLIVCDDHPVQWRELFGFIAACAGQAEPALGAPEGFPSFRLKNTRAKQTLDWRPFYASYREGLAR
jgi:nucleoside-diphosphate-sugar epimerase